MSNTLDYKSFVYGFSEADHAGEAFAKLIREIIKQFGEDFDWVAEPHQEVVNHPTHRFQWTAKVKLKDI